MSMSSNDAPTITTVDYAGNKRQRWLGSLGSVRGSLGRHDGTTQNFQKNSQRKSKEGANIEFPSRPQWQPLNIPLSRAWENIRAWLVVRGGQPLTNPLQRRHEPSRLRYRFTSTWQSLARTEMSAGPPPRVPLQRTEVSGGDMSAGAKLTGAACANIYCATLVVSEL